MQVDLVGGYHDAGDNVKFGLPMAFTITMMSWSLIEYGKQMAAGGELNNALDAIKWGTDYLIKAHAEPNVLYGEVGDGNTDHYCWQRPEDLTTSRAAYKIDPSNPGSDLAGETAAAMAAASIVFRRYNPSYAKELLEHAYQVGYSSTHYILVRRTRMINIKKQLVKFFPYNSVTCKFHWVLSCGVNVFHDWHIVATGLGMCRLAK